MSEHGETSNRVEINLEKDNFDDNPDRDTDTSTSTDANAGDEVEMATGDIVNAHVQSFLDKAQRELNTFLNEDGSLDHETAKKNDTVKPNKKPVRPSVVDAAARTPTSSQPAIAQVDGAGDQPTTSEVKKTKKRSRPDQATPTKPKPKKVKAVVTDGEDDDEDDESYPDYSSHNSTTAAILHEKYVNGDFSDVKLDYVWPTSGSPSKKGSKLIAVIRATLEVKDDEILHAGILAKIDKYFDCDKDDKSHATNSYLRAVKDRLNKAMRTFKLGNLD